MGRVKGSRMEGRGGRTGAACACACARGGSRWLGGRMVRGWVNIEPFLVDKTRLMRPVGIDMPPTTYREPEAPKEAQQKARPKIMGGHLSHLPSRGSKRSTEEWPWEPSEDPPCFFFRRHGTDFGDFCQTTG